MDAFGIGTAIKGLMEVYIRNARQSGRTTALLESLKDGDRIIFDNRNEAKRVERLLKEWELDVKCIVISPNDPLRIMDYGTSQGRTVFDHGWLEKYYQSGLDYLIDSINHYQKQTSGYGAAHIETKIAAKELAKWRI